MFHQNYTSYLQKELDFLKLLVARFHEQEKVAHLELDVALLKTQEIYEQLLKLKFMSEQGQMKVETPHKTTVTVPPIEEKSWVDHAEQPKPIKQPEVHIDVAPVVSPTKNIRPVEEPQEIVVPKKEKETTIPKAEPAPAREEKIKPEKPVTQPTKPGNEILAEKIRPTTYQPINETLAQQKSSNDLSSKWQTAPLESIASGIGLNDKFLYIRELFHGDNTLYNNTVRHLDTLSSLNDAMDFIHRHFTWDKENDTTQKFITLVQRRHGN